VHSCTATPILAVWDSCFHHGLVDSIFPSHARSPGSNPGGSNTTQVEKSTSLQFDVLCFDLLLFDSYLTFCHSMFCHFDILLFDVLSFDVLYGYFLVGADMLFISLELQAN